MTIIKYFGLTDDEFNAYGGELTFSSFVSSSADQYIFTNTDGQRVTMTGDLITVDENGRFVSGTIRDIKFAPRGGSNNDIDVRIEDIRLDGTEVLGSGGNNVPTSDKAWQAVLEGDVKLVTRGDGFMDFALDAPQLRNSDILDGSDGEVNGDFGVNSYISGNVGFVRDNATVFGGQLQFDGQASYVNGDATGGLESAVLIGGDDTLTFDRGDDFPNLYATSSISFGGEAWMALDDSTVVGGDDVINMRDARTSQTVFSCGDVSYVQGTSTLIGGDDDLRGAMNAKNEMFGDARVVSSTATFVGGNDRIVGGNEDDIIWGDHGTNANGVAGGNDFLYGGGGADRLYGNGGNDRLFDSFGAGDHYGGDGNDRFIQTRNGAHDFDGGNGIDIIDYSESSVKVIIDLENQTGTGGWASNDSFSNVEGARGSTRGDTLYGTDGSDLLYGDKGNDSLVGRGGGDSLFAGAGQDQLVGTSSADVYFGGAGFDVLDYGDSDAGIRVYLDTNVMSGGHAEGDVATSVENIFASDHNDRLRGDDANNFLRGRDGDDIVRGENGADRVAGQDGDDMVFGGRGSDRVFGGAGNDYVSGGSGNDLMKGEGGADTFHFKRGDDYDRIRDFQNNTDTLLLEGVGRNPLNNARQVGDDVYINLGRGDQLYIDDITINQLRNDIEFA